MVDEPKEGSFRLVLIEATGEYIETWIEVRASEEFSPTYHQAMAAGLLTLQAQIENLDVGPREAPHEPVRAVKHGGLFGISLGATLRL